MPDRFRPASLLRLLIAVLVLLGAPAVQAAERRGAKPLWAFEASDLPLDTGFRYGALANGMRYIVRRNTTTEGTLQVRLNIAAGSLDEREDERGFAHFVEHMAFNGSTRVPEGEMVRLLERKGLAFGADTNATTGFEHTLYMLDLPRNDPALIDTALMLMRETASELRFDPGAVVRERGVVLSELRDGRGYARDNLEDQIAFLYPRATYGRRLPIGTVETLNAATAERLRAFWAREYVPASAVLVVVGDCDVDAVEAAIRAHFADWKPRPASPRPDQGKILPRQKGEADVFVHPALSERVTVSRHGAWLDEPDSIATRRVNLLRRIGYAALNRRFQSMSRAVDPPFRGAGFGTSDVFRIGRTTNLVIDTPDGQWRRGLAAAAAAYREALAHGFSAAEVAEQVAVIRTSVENVAASAETRSHAALVEQALALVRDDQVPTAPEGVLARFTVFAPTITPQAVLAALRSEALPLDDPLIRFQGRTAPAGGARALRAAWKAAIGGRGASAAAPAAGAFAYTDFGPAGRVVSDRVEPVLGIREVRFANGVMLNLRRSETEKDRVQLRLAIDGGEMLETREDPLAVEMVSVLASGGLGKHSQDELQSLLAGRSVTMGLSASGDAFTASATTTRRDLELQLQLLAASIADPGYRPEAEVLFRQNMTNFFARIDSTPSTLLATRIGEILTPGDPRFALQPPAAYQALGFDRLRTAIGDRLAHGAIELSLVGDIDPDAAIALVARTFGALPPREAAFGAWTEARRRGFTGGRGLTVLRHKGAREQALVRQVWPTTDDSDADTALALELLEEVAQVEVLDSVREALGKAYSPSANAVQSRVWRGWGTFTLSASVDVTDVAAVRAAFAATVADLQSRPVDPDVLDRARAPMLQRLDNLLKSDSGWSALAARAQSQPDRLTRFVTARARLERITGADMQALARRFLAGKPVEVLVLPEGAPAPAA